MRQSHVLPATTALLGGCATADQVQALEKKVEELEKKVTALEARPAGPAGAAPVDPAAEEAAQAIYKEIDELVKTGDVAAASAKMKELEQKHGSTTTWKRARKLAMELEVVGREVPADWASSMVETWYQGQGEIDLTKGATLVVFWEEWCPHCKREVPKLIETNDKWEAKGMKVAGFTKITKSSTEEKVKAFMAEQKVDYPVAKENGKASELFNVSGIPAAALVKDGKVIWRGHPARLDDDTLTKLLGS